MNFDLKNTLCFGVAGNFAGHLDQAKENADFVNVKTQSAEEPKGLFPYYQPESNSFKGAYPLSSTQINYPEDMVQNAHLQLEAELCVVFEVVYHDALVTDLIPKGFAAFNDCSIRKEGAKKISEKKNWGANSKGVSANFLPLTQFEKGGELDTFHIASFLRRDDVLHSYGVDSPVITYSYFYGKLKNWMIDKFNHQQDFGPLENLADIFQSAGYPKQIMVSLGATSYTDFGEHVFLQPGDEVSVYVYDASQNDAETIAEHALGHAVELKNSSCLTQVVV